MLLFFWAFEKIPLSLQRIQTIILFINQLKIFIMAENYTVDPKDVQDNKVMAILAYFGILFLVPLIAAKESPFARFHTNQGILLCIAGVVLNVVLYTLMIILALIHPIFMALAGIISLVCGIGLLALMIIGIINAAKGEAKELPVIGKYKILK
jgi:uncharacterized membrane protein